jgi:hypothetical protein
MRALENGERSLEMVTESEGPIQVSLAAMTALPRRNRSVT